MYRSLREAVVDLERHQLLVRIDDEIDAHLELAELHRQVFAAGGPSLWFMRIKNSPFQVVSNLYGSKERIHFLFRHTLKRVEQLIRAKADPGAVLRQPLSWFGLARTALTALPRRTWQAPVLKHRTTIAQLPQLVSWPMDGGGFITLPQVMTLPPGEHHLMKSNLGMYRIQLSGNAYEPDKEVGMHYQLHRGIGVHHTAYNESANPFRCAVFVGGPPAHAFAAIMPLPEGLSEVTFAGLLGGRRYRYTWWQDYPIHAEADFCLVGEILKQVRKPEGPFGDHLGYYSLKHDFPVMKVAQVFHRPNPLWHCTVVGRPPQEDSYFGYLIHELVGPLTAAEFPGLEEVNAVDAAGVHPLLIAIGQERYMPFREKKPEEILTIASHLLGKGQTSLAKYLIIAARDEHAGLHTHDISGFFRHVLERVDWRRDLHFHTNTTIDTLDYSGHGWNSGSKVVIACRGPQLRELGTEKPPLRLPPGFERIEVGMPGVMIIQGPAYHDPVQGHLDSETLAAYLHARDLEAWPLVVIADDAHFVAQSLNNFLWVTFTRSNPATDIHGVGAMVQAKHWGCTGPLIIDARKKPHHAPELVPDPRVEKKVREFIRKHAVLKQWGA